mgnify:CR=1 FL=1|tara:strand:- start:391 stop:1062 length:672 start_codon:yes stop_codon:yes gene_type:complete
MGSQKKYDLKSFEKKLIKNTKHAKKIAENMTPEMAEKIVGPLERWGSGPDTAYDHVAYELFYPDRIVATWKNIGSLAQRFCDTPQDVLDLLVKYGAKDFKVSDQKRFYLVSFINNEMNKKINKGIGLRTIIGENLEACCKLIEVPFEQVSPSKTQTNKNPKLRGGSFPYDYDKVVEQIVEKHRRVMGDREVLIDFRKWIREEYRQKEINEFIKNPVPKKKKKK